MRTHLTKLFSGILLMTASAAAFAASDCCADLAECCLQVLACCL
jgi:hypothetical protein